MFLNKQAITTMLLIVLLSVGVSNVVNSTNIIEPTNKEILILLLAIICVGAFVPIIKSSTKIKEAGIKVVKFALDKTDELSKGIGKGFVVLGEVAKKGVNFIIKPRNNNQLKADKEQLWLNEKGHNGIALLFNTDKSIKKWFYANSQITLHKVSKYAMDNGYKSPTYFPIRISEDDVRTIENHINNLMLDADCILCTEDTLNSMHVPLAIVTPELNFEYISANESDYPRIQIKPYINFENFKEHTELRDRVHCSEKKILHKILDMYPPADLQDCTLLFFSEMPPCTSCLTMLVLEKQATTFKEVKCYYKDILLLLQEDFYQGLNDEEQAEIKRMIEQLKEVSKVKSTKLKDAKDIDEP